MDERDGLDLVSGFLSLAMLGSGLFAVGYFWCGMYGPTVLAWFGK